MKMLHMTSDLLPDPGNCPREGMLADAGSGSDLVAVFL